MKNQPPPKSAVEIVVTDRKGHLRAKAPAAELAPVNLRLRRILVPLDFSEPSHQALRYARVFAGQFDASLTLLHVIEPVVYPAELGYVPIVPDDLEEKRTEELKARLKTLAQDLGGGSKVETMMRVGRSWREICDAAKADNTDLIIIATHGYTGLKHALLGSTAERVVRHAPCPVLVVRTDEHDFA